MLERLASGVRERLKHAYAPGSSGPVNSALAALARFADACPGRELFRRPRYHGDLEASAFNEWTLLLLAEFLVTTPSPTTGKPVAVDTARTYVSLLKGYLEFAYTFTLVHEPKRLGRMLQQMARSEPLGGIRKKRRGFRRRHLRRLWRRFEWARREDVDTVNDMACVGTAWHTLARGGELAPSAKPSEWRPERHPTRADLAFRCRPDGHRYAVLWLRPLKKKGKTLQPKIPQYISEHDGSGSDVYMLLQRLVQLDPVPESERATTPLFRSRAKGGKRTHMTVARMRGTVRKYAKALGYTAPKEWGAHSGRIGGATDLASTGKASELVLRAKGRWASDIGAIYARLTTRSLLAASKLMQKARGRDIEEVIPEFVQPA